MKCWLHTFSPEGRNSERKGSNSAKPIPGSGQRGLGCGKKDTRKVARHVCPWRIMIGLCPQKVTLESFCTKQTHTACLQSLCSTCQRDKQGSHYKTHPLEQLRTGTHTNFLLLFSQLENQPGHLTQIICKMKLFSGFRYS